MKLEMRIFNNFFPVIRDVAIRMTMIILIWIKRTTEGERPCENSKVCVLA